MKKIIFTLIAINLFGQDIYASFDVVARKSAKLALPAVGILDKLYVDVGSKVKEDDLLLELDYSLDSIGLNDAKTQLDIANIGLKHAQNTYNRYYQVKSVVDAQTIEDIKSKKEELEQRQKQAKLNILKYETLIKNKKLLAPFNGVISSKHIEVGEGVAGVQQPLLVIDSYPEVKLLLSFDEKYKDLIQVGDEFEYIINGLKKVGSISKIYPNIDVRSRKVFAEVLAKDLTIGSFGEGYIKVKDK